MKSSIAVDRRFRLLSRIPPNKLPLVWLYLAGLLFRISGWLISMDLMAVLGLLRWREFAVLSKIWDGGRRSLLLLLTVSLRVLFFSFFFVVFFFSGLSLRAPNYLSLFRGICMCHVGVTRVGSRPWAKGRGGDGGFLSLALSAFLPSAIIFSFFSFYPNWGGAGGLGLSAPSPRSTTGHREVNSSLVFT